MDIFEKIDKVLNEDADMKKQIISSKMERIVRNVEILKDLWEDQEVEEMVETIEYLNKEIKQMSASLRSLLAAENASY